MSGKYRVVLVDYDTDLFDLTPAICAGMEEILAVAGARLDVGRCRTEDELLAMATAADLVMIQTVKPLTPRVISGLTQCRALIRMGLGYDSIDIPAATALGIPVSNVVDWCNDEVAEHTMALLLAGVRRLMPLSRHMRAGEWPRAAAAPIYRLRGQTVGIVGFGRVGRAVAQRLAGFGVALLACDPRVDAQTADLYRARKVGLDDLLRHSDIISLHPRLNETSYHLLSVQEFAAMKDGVFVVNTSRGAVIDEPALVAALRSGKVAGAALDVMEQEPLPADSPLRRFDNVILSPHIASYSVESGADLYRLSAETAAHLLQGYWAPTIVNPEVREKAEARWGPYKALP